MHKFWASIKKETLLLLRDPGGLAILFIMPLVLLIVITMVQDNTFKTISDTKIPILLVDNDKGFVSEGIIDSLGASGNFKVVLMENGEEARNLVGVGEYQLAIELPPNLSSGLEKKVGKNVQGILESFGLEEGSNDTAPTIVHEVVLYFDPASQPSFRNSVRNGIDKMIYQIESQSIYQAFQEQLSSVADAAPAFDTTGFITFREMAPGREGEAPIPNSSQHNVPAWTLFAIFFIIVPLSINLVKEKNQGTSVRLRTQPVRYRTILAGKTAVYVVVCLLQFALMLALGVYLFPSLGLPGLEVKGKLILLFVVAFFAGLAAIGLGVLLGTIANSQEQSAPFGATLVVILASLGGVWVPVFVMPRIMQSISKISPMNWGLNAFYDVFLRDGTLGETLPEIGLLFLFFVLAFGAAIVYNAKKNTI